jgi:8-oxo-dGTP pyrophosphatase MutT (NUDIX family)
MIVWRNGAECIEVLMGRRSHRASFVPGYFVFPGGQVDPTDHAVCPATPLLQSNTKRVGAMANAIAIAAVRETFEETGLLLAESGDIGCVTDASWDFWRANGLAPGLHHLHYFGRAITSPISPIRFHARFFVARADSLRGELAGSGELSELDFYPVTEALSRMPLVDVTEFMLNRLVAYASTSDRCIGSTPLFTYKLNVPVVRYE